MAKKIPLLFLNYTFFSPVLMQMFFRSSTPLWDTDVTMWSYLRSGSRAGGGHLWGWICWTLGRWDPARISPPVEGSRRQQCSELWRQQATKIKPNSFTCEFQSLPPTLSWCFLLFSRLFSIHIPIWLQMISVCIFSCILTLDPKTHLFSSSIDIST